MAQEQKCKYFQSTILRAKCLAGAMLSRLRECIALYDPRQPLVTLLTGAFTRLQMIRDTATGTDDSVRLLSDFSNTRLRIVFSSHNYTLQQAIKPAVQNRNTRFQKPATGSESALRMSIKHLSTNTTAPFRRKSYKHNCLFLPSIGNVVHQHERCIKGGNGGT